MAMPACGDFFRGDLAAVERYSRKGDTRGLIRLLKSRDARVSEAAQGALSARGPGTAGVLLARLEDPDNRVRLGIIGVLARLRDRGAAEALVRLLSDPVNEVRWQAALALGEIADPASVFPLTGALKDPDKYVRYGAAASLVKLGWKPATEEETTLFYAAVQDWSAIRDPGPEAAAALSVIFADRDPGIRQKIVRTLGDAGSADAAPLILRALADPDREVRWQAVLASRKCGVSSLQLPRAIEQRPRERKSPVIAAFMNFMLPGLGYGYLGRWWGIMIFQIDITATVWLFTLEGEEVSFLVLLPLYLVLAAHAWYLADTQPEDPP